MLKYINLSNYKDFYRYLSDEQMEFVEVIKNNISTLVKNNFEFIDREVLDNLKELFLDMKYKRFSFNNDTLDIDAFIDWMKKHRNVSVMCMNESMDVSNNFGLVADNAMYNFYTGYFHEVIADSMFVSIVQNIMTEYYKLNFK